LSEQGDLFKLTHHYTQIAARETKSVLLNKLAKRQVFNGNRRIEQGK
jgi:hypothetical protein